MRRAEGWNELAVRRGGRHGGRTARGGQCKSGFHSCRYNGRCGTSCRRAQKRAASGNHAASQALFSYYSVFVFSPSSTLRIVVVGIAKPMPCASALTAVLMPMTSPSSFSRGPPELPGLIDASVWSKCS